MNIQEKAKAFRELHLRSETFVMPNAWNAGSARLLEQGGFKAIGTTSAGVAYSIAVPDNQGDMPFTDALEETRRIAAAVDVPVSMDAENGYGHSPEEVAKNIREMIATGIAGASIEDYTGDVARGLYDRELAVERVRAAREAADSMMENFTLTARAECYFVDCDDPFAESVERCNLFREAGADCLYTPGMKSTDEMGSFAREVNGPVNVVIGLVGEPITVARLQDLGIKRISIGGSLARATFWMVRQAAEELANQGTFNFTQNQISDTELNNLFSKSS